jgi:hypothetical protein
VSATPDPVAPGQSVTYQITVSNPGSSATGPFAVYATVPNGTTVPAGLAPNANCSGGSWPCQPGQQVYWGIGLNAGASETLQFAALVDSGTSAPANGTVLTTDVTCGGWGGQGQGVAVVGAAGPSLAVTAPGEVSSGAEYTYTLTYANGGTATDSTALVMAVPTGTTFVSASNGGKNAAGLVTWTFSGMAPGDVVTQRMVVKAAAASGLVPADINVFGANGVQSYSRFSAQTTIASTNALQVGVSATPDPVAPGQSVTYQITVSNPGSSATGPFAVYATVPNGTTVPAGLAPNANCSGGSWPCQPGQQVYWGIGLNAGASQTLQFAALVDSGTSAPANGTVLTTDVTCGGLAGSAQSVAIVESE